MRHFRKPLACFFVLLLAQLTTLQLAAALPPVVVNTTAPESLPKGVGLELTGTGETTGTIGHIRVTNLSLRPVYVYLPPSFIPPERGFQGYVAPEPTRATVPPGREEEIPIHGYCIDIGVEPVPRGSPLPASFYGADGRPSFGPGDGPASGKPVFGDPARERNFPKTRRPLPVPTYPYVSDIFPPLLERSDPGYRDIKAPVHNDGDPAELAKLLIPINQEIARAYDRLKEEERIVNPIPMGEEEERDAFIQQTFWLTTGVMREEDPYTVEDLEERMTEQLEEKLGRPVEELPEENQEELKEGIGDIFESMVLVGAEAKVLRDPSGNGGGGTVGGGSTVAEGKTCIQGPILPPIDNWDLYGDAFADGRLGTDPAVFLATLHLAVAQAEAMAQSIRTSTS